MNQRTFRYKLRSSHRPPERSTTDLVVEFLCDSGLGEPQQLSLGDVTPFAGPVRMRVGGRGHAAAPC